MVITSPLDILGRIAFLHCRSVKLKNQRVAIHRETGRTGRVVWEV